MYPTEKIVRITVANRNAAGVYSPVPKPVANGTLNSIAEIGAAPVTATKITPMRPTAFGFRRSTPASATDTDSIMPGWRTSTLGSGWVVDIDPLLLVPSGQSCPTALRLNQLHGQPASALHLIRTPRPA